MANEYSFPELTDMLLIYGEAEQDSELAAELYAERFPKREAPSPETFVAIVQSGRETGRLELPNRNEGHKRFKRITTDKQEESSVTSDTPPKFPKLSEFIKEEDEVTEDTISLSDPYYIQCVQVLEPEDCKRRVNFCNWLLSKHEQNPLFTADILCTDECIFTENGIQDRRETYKWTSERPQSVRQTQHFSLNVWAGIVGGQLIGPVMFPDTMDGLQYVKFLERDLPNLLEDLPIGLRQKMWFLQGGTPERSQHRSAVKQHLTDIFGVRWIAHGGPVGWPPQSLDLNPVFFFLWTYLKYKVYSSEVNTVGELQERIKVEVEKLRQKEQSGGGILGVIGKNWIRRAQTCVDIDGGDFRHLL